MAKGMAIPVTTNRRGGAKLRQGERYLKQAIGVGLTPNTSRNPFQAGGGIEIGIDERIIFARNDVTAQGLARRTINRFFARFRSAGLAKLVPGTDGLSFSRKNGRNGDLIARVNYVDLEADEEREIDSNLKDALRSFPNAGGKL